MFAKLKQRWKDTRTIMALSLDAEKRALQEGHKHPGAEHYTLAALDLEDGSARRVFARIGVNPGSLSRGAGQPPWRRAERHGAGRRCRRDAERRSAAASTAFSIV